MFLCPGDFLGKNTGVGCIAFSRDLPYPGTKPGSPALQADSLVSELSGKPEKGFEVCE